MTEDDREFWNDAVSDIIKAVDNNTTALIDAIDKNAEALNEQTVATVQMYNDMKKQFL